MISFSALGEESPDRECAADARRRLSLGYAVADGPAGTAARLAASRADQRGRRDRCCSLGI
jgi:hypothetical protein